ncbi:hypothetical protein hmeg3_15040 [Herbaspirillum sp. meg3]|nr:hypothetical protein hmeg3_15040 [Herbaspirillum sp. meg3]
MKPMNALRLPTPKPNSPENVPALPLVLALVPVPVQSEAIMSAASACSSHSARLVATDPALLQALAGAGFADTFRIALTDEQGRLSAGELTRQMFSRTPEWVSLLLATRNRVVALFGLKQADLHIDGDTSSTSSSVAGVPVVTQSEDQVQLGFDDKHLDFRIWVRREPGTTELSAQLTVTTVVRTNQWLGRAYLAVIKPFHRRIVPAMLNRLTH